MAVAQPGTGALSGPPRLRAAYAAAFAGALVFLAVAAWTQVARRDLDVVHDTLSMYLHGPWGLLLRWAYGALASAVIVLGTALYHHVQRPRRSAAVLLLWCFAALGLLGVAVGDSWLPAEAPLLWPFVHGVAAMTAFLCASVGLLLQAWYLRAAAGWERRGRLLWGWAWLAFVLLWGHVLLRAIPRGAGQKLVIVVIVGWLLCAAWTGWRMARRTRGPA